MPRNIGRFGSAAALALIAVAGVAASAVQAPSGAGVTGEVAYTRFWEDAAPAHWITVADLAGTERHEITQRPGKNASWDDHSPVWSVDGSRLAFVREGRKSSGLYVANHDGTAVRRVLRLPNVHHPGYGIYDASDFSWSPDGHRLALAYGPLYVVNADGTNSRRLFPSSTCNPSWSPDGKSLLYLADDDCDEGRGGNDPESGFRSIYRIDADGAHRRLLASGSFGDAAWSPDGRNIAYTAACQVLHGGDWFCSVFLMKSDGSGKRPLIRDSGGWVAWAAGGKEVLWPDYPSAFRATNLATGRTHRVLPASYEDGYPVGISGDGQRIAVLATSNYSIWNSPHPIPPLIVVTLSGRLIQKITVPRGWEARTAHVYLR